MFIGAEGKGGVDISGRFERRVGLDWGVGTVELGIKGLGRVEASACGDGTVVGTGVDGVWLGGDRYQCKFIYTYRQFCFITKINVSRTYYNTHGNCHHRVANIFQSTVQIIYIYLWIFKSSTNSFNGKVCSL